MNQIECACECRLAADPEERVSQKGKAYIRLRGAVGSDDAVQWLNVTAIGEQAVAAAKQLLKGDRCYIEGSLGSMVDGPGRGGAQRPVGVGLAAAAVGQDRPSETRQGRRRRPRARRGCRRDCKPERPPGYSQTRLAGSSPNRPAAGGWCAGRGSDPVRARGAVMPSAARLPACTCAACRAVRRRRWHFARLYGLRARTGLRLAGVARAAQLHEAAAAHINDDAAHNALETFRRASGLTHGQMWTAVLITRAFDLQAHPLRMRRVLWAQARPCEARAAP